jgi:hypothetical protein
LGYYPWSYWPGPYFGYYGYPDYPFYGCDDPYGPYPCDPSGYGAYGGDPYSYGPYVGDPGDPPAASTYTSNDDPPPMRNAFVADGRWHRFGENSEPVAAYARAASPRSIARPLVRAAYAGDGQWHHFGGGINAMATTNHGASTATAWLKGPTARSVSATHTQAGNASGK